jgi:ribosomal protein L11 methyltransferase
VSESARGHERFQGIDVGSYWHVLPPWVDAPDDDVPVIRIDPGGGAFGTGTHETTQLCLLAIGNLLRTGFRPETVLDFGSGSGILSIAAARFGARVEAVEIDPGSVERSEVNAALNDVAGLIEHRARMSEPARTYDLVAANILSSVLTLHADDVCQRVSRSGRLVLSGLVATDVPVILARYKPRLTGMKAQVFERGNWRAIVFVPDV